LTNTPRKTNSAASHYRFLPNQNETKGWTIDFIAGQAPVGFDRYYQIKNELLGQRSGQTGAWIEEATPHFFAIPGTGTAGSVHFLI